MHARHRRISDVAFAPARRDVPGARPPRSPAADLRALHAGLGNRILARLLAAPADPLPVFRGAARGAAREVPYRREMEQRFGEDFADVRAFTGRRLDLLPLGARAATHGDDVVFGDVHPGRSVVVHELAHVVQHRRAGRRPAAGMSRASDAAEVEARAVADGAAPGRDVQAPPTAGVQLATLTAAEKRQIYEEAIALVIGMSDVRAAKDYPRMIKPLKDKLFSPARQAQLDAEDMQYITDECRTRCAALEEKHLEAVAPPPPAAAASAAAALAAQSAAPAPAQTADAKSAAAATVAAQERLLADPQAYTPKLGDQARAVLCGMVDLLVEGVLIPKGFYNPKGYKAAIQALDTDRAIEVLRAVADKFISRDLTLGDLEAAGVAPAPASAIDRIQAVAEAADTAKDVAEHASNFASGTLPSPTTIISLPIKLAYVSGNAQRERLEIVHQMYLSDLRNVLDADTRRRAKTSARSDPWNFLAPAGDFFTSLFDGSLFTGGKK
jgi:hypothetical protein